MVKIQHALQKIKKDPAQIISRTHCKPFAEAGLTQVVCPGVNAWSSWVPKIEDARTNISEFAKMGAASKVLGLLNCDWGDMGHTT